MRTNKTNVSLFQWIFIKTQKKKQRSIIQHLDFLLFKKWRSMDCFHCMPSTFNTLKFFSIGAKCVVCWKPDHSATMKSRVDNIININKYNHYFRLRTLLMQCSRNLIEKMSDSGLVYDEFFLLLAILLSNSNADGISQIGRKKL
jgi:hypothetical protein